MARHSLCKSRDIGFSYMQKARFHSESVAEERASKNGSGGGHFWGAPPNLAGGVASVILVKNPRFFKFYCF